MDFDPGSRPLFGVLVEQTNPHYPTLSNTGYADYLTFIKK